MRESQTFDPKEYWAAADSEMIAPYSKAKFEEYEDYLEKSGSAERMRAAHNQYYNINRKGALRLEKIDGGAEVKATCNDYRNLLKNMHILVTQNKLAFSPVAINSDAKSLGQTRLGKGLIQYYVKDKGLGMTLSRAVEGGIVNSEYFVEAPWNRNKGFDIRPDETDEVMQTGDQDYHARSAFDVARDPAAKEGSLYYIVKKNTNKWNLAALHPEHRDYILECGVDDGMWARHTDEFSFDGATCINRDDLVTTYTLYHDRCPVLQEGRQVLCVGERALEDGPLKYKRPPVYRICAAEMLEALGGHSVSFDMLAMQELLDVMISALGSNNVNFCKQNIWSPDPNMDLKAVSQGMNLLSSAQKPEALQLTQSSPEAYKFVEFLTSKMATISAVNNTVRGNPESSLKSGNSLAMMMAAAIQFMSELQKSYAKLASDVATQTIENIQAFAQEEMIATIGGIGQSSYVKRFKSEDVCDIIRVDCDIGNPITQTIQGRWDMAVTLMANGAIKNPEDFVTVMETGQTDSLTEKPFNEALTIRRENEFLLDGGLPKALLIDNHRKHILEHRSVIDDPHVRQDPNLSSRTLAHILQHIQLMRMVPPDLQAVLDGAPLPMLGAPPGVSGVVGGEVLSEDFGNGQNGDEVPEVGGVNIPTLPTGAPMESRGAFEQFSSGVQNMQNGGVM